MKTYDSWENKSKFKNPRSKIAILAVVIVALVLIVSGSLLAYETTVGGNTISSLFSSDKSTLNGVATVSAISFDSEAIGMTADLSQVYVKLTYSDGSTRQVALSRLNPQGLDLTVEGKQNISITYGGEEWPLKVSVVSAEITIKYTVTDGGTIKGISTQTLPAGQNCSTVVAVPNEGYQFDGWNDGLASDTRQDTQISQNAEYRARFTRKTYRVRFYSQRGGFNPIVEVPYGGNVAAPSLNSLDYIRYGYIANGWIDAEKLNNVTSSFDMYCDYLTNYANFQVYVTASSATAINAEGEYDNALGLKETQETQTVHVNGHSLGTSIADTPAESGYERKAILYEGFYEYGANSAITVTANAGAVLSHWLVLTASGDWIRINPGAVQQELVVLSSGIEAVSFSSSVAGATSSLAFSLNHTEAAATLKVVAVMEYERNVISFEDASDPIGNLRLEYTDTLTAADVASAIGENVEVVRDGGGNVVTFGDSGLPLITKYGYTFAGWFVKNSSTAVTSSTRFAENTVVEARWEVNDFEVNFLVGDSDNLATDTTAAERNRLVAYNSAIGTAFLTVEPVRENYTFVGWFENTDTAYRYAVTAGTFVLAPMTLVPRFIPKEHTLNFSIEGQMTITEQRDLLKDSVYILSAIDGSRTPSTVVVRGVVYYLYPTSDALSARRGTYLAGVVSLDGHKAYYVYTDSAYSLSALNSQDGSVTAEAGKIKSVTLRGTTYYAYPSQDDASLKVGSYAPTSKVLFADETRYYVNGNLTYQLSGVADSAVYVNEDDGTLSRIHLGDYNYYVDAVTGDVYFDAEHTAYAGTYHLDSSLLNLSSSTATYYVDVDNRGLYRLFSVASTVHRAADVLTSIVIGNKTYYINEDNEVFTIVGGFATDVLTLNTEQRYYIDKAVGVVYSMTEVAFTGAAASLLIEGTLYYVDGDDYVYTAVGNANGNLYEIGDSVYYALSNSDLYELSSKADAVLEHSAQGELIAISIAGTRHELSPTNYSDGLLSVGGQYYFVYRGEALATDSAERIVYETDNYVYRVEWSENYELSSLTVNGIEYKDIVETGNTFAVLVLRYGGTGAFVNLNQNLAVVIELNVKRYDIGVTYSDGVSGTGVQTATSRFFGEDAIAGDRTVSINKGESVEIDFTAPQSMAVFSVTVNGVAQTVTPNSPTYYLRLTALSEAKNIEIVFRTLVFDVALTDGVGAAEVVSSVDYNQAYSVTLTAAAGKYINKIYYLGSVVNIYDCAYVDTDNIKVNYRARTAEELADRDARITELVFSIEHITRDASILVYYEDIYYNFAVSVTGNGTLVSEEHLTLADGGTANISIDIPSGYRVDRYTVVKAELNGGIYQNVLTTVVDPITYRFTNVKEDRTLVYYVVAITSNIVFSTNSAVSITDGNTVKDITSVGSFTVAYNDDATFALSAPEGKVITSLVENGSNSYVLPYEATSFTVIKTGVTVSSAFEVVLSDKAVDRGSGSGNIVMTSNVRGSVSALTASGRNTSYVAGESITFRFVPQAGYDLSGFVIATDFGSSSYVKGNASFAAVASLTDTAGLAYYTMNYTAPASGDIIVTPQFEERTYNVRIRVSDTAQDGDGSVLYGFSTDNLTLKATNLATDYAVDITDTATFGYTYKLYFRAEQDSYVSRIKVNGVDVDFGDFEENTIKTNNGKFSLGSLSFVINKALDIEVVFAIDTFSVSVVGSGGGTATADKATYFSGETVNISMQADSGYHIHALAVNGEYVNPELFLNSTAEDLLKFNTVAVYGYQNITQNLSVVVYFETNTYILNYYASNVSDNYAAIDTEYPSYGNINVGYDGGSLGGVVLQNGIATSGFTTYNAVYRGIKHGDSISVDIGTYNRNGYVINRVVLMLTSGSSVVLSANASTAEYVFVMNASKEYANLTVLAVNEDVFSLSVEYTRKTYTVSATFFDDIAFGEGPQTEAGLGGVGFTFSNDQSAQIPTVTQLTAHSYQLEYGLQYRLSITPRPEYNISLFTLGGVTHGYINSNANYGRGDIRVAYSEGIVNGNKNFEVSYLKKTFTVGLTMNESGESLGAASIQGTSDMTKVVYYGDDVMLIFIPYTEEMGGYVSRFVLNNAVIELGAPTITAGVYTYEYFVENVTEDITAQIYFDILTYDVSYVAGTGGTVRLAHPNGDTWRGIVNWGGSVNVTIDLTESYELLIYKVNGTTITVTEDIINQALSTVQIVFALDDLTEDTIIEIPFSLKQFTASISVNNASVGQVDIEEREGGGQILNRDLHDNATLSATVVCTKSVNVYIKPIAGYVVSGITVRMHTLQGTISTLVISPEVYDELHADWRKFVISNISGDIEISAVFVAKQYAMSISIIGETASVAFDNFDVTSPRGNRNIGNYSTTIANLLFGDNTNFSMYLKDGFDIENFIINGRNYYGELSRVATTYNDYNQSYTISDELINVLTEDGTLVSGSGSDYTITVQIYVGRDLFGSVITKTNVTDIAATDDILTLSGNWEFLYGNSTYVSAAVADGYEISKFRLLRDGGLEAIDLLALDSMSFVYADGLISSLSGYININAVNMGWYEVNSVNPNLYDKTVKLVIEFRIKTYAQQTVEFVLDKTITATDAGSSVATISSTTAAYQYETATVPAVGNFDFSAGRASSVSNYSTVATLISGALTALGNSGYLSETALQYGARVTVESNLTDNSGNYRFWGYQEYINGVWSRVEGDQNGIEFAAGSNNKFYYTVYSARTFRAIYVRYYTVSVDILPFHKSTSGVAPAIAYVSYVNLTVSSTDPFSGTATYLSGTAASDIDTGVYSVGYGSVMFMRGSDSYTSGRYANATTSVDFYKNEAGTYSNLTQAYETDSFSKAFVVDDDYTLSAVYENNVQVVLSYDTLGGTNKEDGGIVSVKNSANQAIARTVGASGTATYSYATKAFETVTITIDVNDYYRFESFTSLIATNRNTADNLVWGNNYETIVSYADLYEDIDGDFRADSDTAVYINGNYTIVRNNDVIVITIFVTENCIYKLNYVKTFEISTEFILGYDSDGTAIEESAEHIKLYTNGTSKALTSSAGNMRYDYGAYLNMSLYTYTALETQPADWTTSPANYYQYVNREYAALSEATAFVSGRYYSRTLNYEVGPNYQFIGWYLKWNGGSNNLFNLANGSYFDAYALEYNIILTNPELAGTVTLNDKNEFSVVLEYLPIYTAYIVNGFDYMTDEDGNPVSQSFYYATSETSLTTVVYASEDYNGTSSVVLQNLSLAKEVRITPYTESQREYDRPTKLQMMPNVVSFNRAFSTAANSLILKAVVMTSYQFNYWEISADGVNWVKIAGTDNQSTYIFNLTQYLEDNVLFSGSTMYFRPNLVKLNTVTVSKVVYYEADGEVSTNSAALRNTSVYIGASGTTTASGWFNGSVTVTATASDTYRFIGWYDKTGRPVNDRTLSAWGSASEGEKELVFAKAGYNNYGTGDYYVDYTYELEARFIRQVTIDFSVINASANGDTNFEKYAPYIYGVPAAAAAGMTYKGTDKNGYEAYRDVVATNNLASIDNASTNKLQRVSITMDAGTYAVLKLTNVSNTDGFDPDIMFRSGFSIGSNCYYNREGDEYYTLYFNYTRSVTVQYVTYGEVTLTNALAETQIRLSKALADIYKEGVDMAIDNGIDVAARYGVVVSGTNKYDITRPSYSATIDADGKLVVTTLNQGNTFADIVLPYIKKTDYTDIKLETVLSQMRSGYVVEDFELNFSYRRFAYNEITIDLVDLAYMPFAGGNGKTQATAYVIKTAKQLSAIEALYTTSSNSPDTAAAEPITVNGLSYVTLTTNAAKYSVAGIYFKMDDTIPATERYLSLGDWQAICRTGAGFNTVFDGSGWEIGNIVSTPDEDYYGIFGQAYQATFNSVDFMGGNDIASSADYVGLLVGKAVGATFNDINQKNNNDIFLGGQNRLGTIRGSNYVGVLAGSMSNCTVYNVYLKLVTVIGTAVSEPKLNEGGEYIRDDFGNIVYETSGGQYIGGIAGDIVNTSMGSASTELVLNNVTVQGGGYIGGIAGRYTSSDGTVYTITNITLMGNSSSFGVTNQSYNVGSIAGEMGENTVLSAIVIASTGIKISVSGYYRHFDGNKAETETEQYIGDSAIGGLIGVNRGTVNNIQLLQGTITMYGSIAGGFVGVNYGTVKNVYIGISGKVLFNLQGSGYYGGMVGFNKGFFNYGRIGSYGTFSGLATDASQLITYQSSLEDNANVLFLSDGSSIVGGENYTSSNGVVHNSWGYLAMGGMVGLNSGRVYNSVTYGKVVHYKRIGSGASATDSLGGIVGANFNSEVPAEEVDETIRVWSCGTSFGIVLGYTVLVTSSLDSVSLMASAGGVIGNHASGYATGLFDYHSVISYYYNAGSPTTAYKAAYVTINTGGIASGIGGFGTFRCSWAFKNGATWSGDSMYIGAIKVAGDPQLVSATEHQGALAYNSLTQGDPETSADWKRCGVVINTANYNTLVGTKTACVVKLDGKAFSTFAGWVSQNSEGNGGTNILPKSATLFDASAYMYYRTASGAQGSIGPMQYNTSPSKATDWMLG